MANLLIITQKVDENDDLLGFFISWLKEFSKKFDKVFVITLAKGSYDLSPNVYIYSLGKERGNSKIARAFIFYKYLFKLVPRASGIFAHMSPIFALAAWPVTFFFRKKIVLWYLHRSLTWRLKLAEKICYKIATAAKESLNLKSSKIIELGHGINADFWKTERNWTHPGQSRIISVGRISPIKNYETLIEAIGILTKRHKLKAIRCLIIGRPVMESDYEYFEYLKLLVAQKSLGNVIKFAGFVPHKQMPDYYKNADVMVNLAPCGGIDKVVLEAMASGTLVLTSNGAFQKYFGQYASQLIFAESSGKELAEKIEKLGQLLSRQKKEMRDFLKKEIAQKHNLSRTIDLISKLFQ